MLSRNTRTIIYHSAFSHSTSLDFVHFTSLSFFNLRQAPRFQPSGPRSRMCNTRMTRSTRLECVLSLTRFTRVHCDSVLYIRALSATQSARILNLRYVLCALQLSWAPSRSPRRVWQAFTGKVYVRTRQLPGQHARRSSGLLPRQRGGAGRGRCKMRSPKCAGPPLPEPAP